jgi:S1-C subfamily serine protease
VQRYGLNGVPIVRVTPGLPASAAGLQGVSRNARGQVVLGDIIVALNGKDVTTNDDLLTALEDFKPGDKVELKIMRDDKMQKFMLRLANPDR